MIEPESKNKLDELKEKKVSKLIPQYAIPSIIGTTVFSLYIIIIQIFIAYGEGLGVHAVGGVGICLPIITLIFAISLLTGIGAASHISICLGKDDKETACDLLGNAVTLSVILSLVFTLLFFLFFEPILRLIGTTEENYPYVKDFLSIFIPGAVVIIVSVSLNFIMRASGYPKKSMFLIVLGLVLSIITIPLFLFVFKSGIKGAAIAVILCQLIAFIPTLGHFFMINKTLSFRFQSFKLKLPILKLISKIGFSPFLVNALIAIVAFIVNNRLMTYGGANAINAYTISNTLVTFIVMILLGLTQGVQPIIGYNHGAKKTERLLDTLKITGCIGVAIGITGLLVTNLFSHLFATLFSPDNQLVVIETSRCLRIISIGLPLAGFQMTVSSFFQSIGSAGKAFMLSFTRQLIFLIPALFVFPFFWQTQGVWYALPFSDILSALFAAIILFFQLKELKIKNKKIENIQ